ncbi:phenylacetate--CoA ligase family protein [Halomonas sp. KM-1]|uniref:phenylacetate--CoA ligase family protein n=1 Tax=Halomonas sp. KM-1 TaxID=590061 RepID=UPI000287FC14|nr:phenylacetate--CoA ligase family protein [Halomonas sp. KM-1]
MVKIYKHLPESIQDLAVTYQGWRLSKHRFGVDFKQSFRDFSDRSLWSKNEIIEYRRRKVLESLFRASLTPFYSRFFASLGMEWQDFEDPEAFSLIPVVSKKEIQAKIDDFRPREKISSDSVIKTSGTTGESFSFPVSKNVEPRQWAVWWRYRNRHSIDIGDRCALFASAPIIQGKMGSRPWRYNRFGNEYRFSIFHISRDTAKLYVDSLNSIRPSWIHGNPTAISLLASYIIELDLPVCFKVKCVTVGSENLLGWQKRVIEKAFFTKVVQHYGLAEAVANISECEFGKLHTDEDFSYVEYLANEKGEACSIIGTPFDNYAFSVLRYDTGDLATLSSEECSCGHPGRVVENLDGRLTDYVILPSGDKVASLAAPFHNADGLAGAQLYQGKDGALTVRYIPASGWDENCLVKLESELRLRVGDKISIKYEKVSEIQKTSRGKMKLVVSELN